MLLKADAAQLEWRVKVFLAQDSVGMKEIAEGGDFHSDNQKTFDFPTRLIAKIFIFRLIFADAFGEQGFRGPAYAYANDNDFKFVSKQPKFWEKVIDKFFTKYPEIHAHSVNMIREATTNGRIVNPSGRFYNFKPRTRRNGEMDWPRSDILNYPVQGLAADFMQLVRIMLKQRLKGYDPEKVLLINTVHDDIELDLDNDPELVYNISLLLEEVFSLIPKAFEATYGFPVNVPMAGEVKMGWTLYDPKIGEGDMVKFKRSSFENDWRQLNGRKKEGSSRSTQA